MNTPILCSRQVALYSFVGKAAGRKLAILALMIFASLTLLHGQSNYATPYTFTTLAGNSPESGSVDGTGSVARFSFPVGLAVDSAGNVYVTDTNNHTIRKITSGGVVTTLAGSAGSNGSVDGTASAARFDSPQGVAVDNSGNVYIADSFNNTIRKITPSGAVTTLAGTAGNSGSADGTGNAAQFLYPTGVAVDTAGNVYVADTGNYTIRKITPAGVVTTLAGSAGISGPDDGTGSTARFSYPQGLAVDSTDNVYVADECTIRKITSGGVVTTLAGLAGNPGSDDGTGNAAQFNYPQGLSVDGAGNVYVADSQNDTIRKITSGGVVTTVAGMAEKIGSAEGTGSAARFNYPAGVAIDSTGNLYIADSGSHTIRKITSGAVVTTLAGKVPNIGSSDGTGTAAGFTYPRAAAADDQGNVYIADSGNHTIRKITNNGAVTTLAGTAGNAGAIDGTGSAARFSSPKGLAVDDAGNVYVADLGNSTIRKITSAGVVTTLAGQAGIQGTDDGTGSAARFSYPAGLAVDDAGNVYVADYGNNAIRKITSAGVVTTLAGPSDGSSGSVDGTGSGARFYGPSGLALDSVGNIYVADCNNSTVRKITSAGVVTTLAGTAGSPGSADGTGSAAQFFIPLGLAVDSGGNVYVADVVNSTIRKITTAGVVTTVAGIAGSQGSADGTGSAARFSSPEGLTVDSAGNLYVADTGNHTIRRGTLAPPVLTSADSANAAFGQSFTHAVIFSGDPTSYSASGLPTGLSLDTATGVISGTPLVLGTFPVTLGANNSAGSVTVTLTIAIRNTQIITFGPLADKNYGDAPFSVNATTNSGLVLSYNIVSGPATISGNLVTLTGGGIVVVRASQAGDSSYAAAQVDRSFTVSTPYTYTFATLAGAFNIIGSANGTGDAAQFSLPEGVAVDGSGNVYVADRNNHIIRKISTGGVVSTFAGSAGVTGSADGTGSAARFNAPMDLAVDGSGNVYVADGANCTIRKITPAGVVTTFAGLPATGVGFILQVARHG